MDIIVYLIVMFICFVLGRCSALDEKEFKRVNKIGHNPSPPNDSKKPEFPTHLRTKSANSLKNIKPPKS